MRIRALMLRIIRQFIRDPRTLALLIIVPILVISLVYLVFNGSAYEPSLGVVSPPPGITQSLSEAGAKVTVYEGEAADTALAKQGIDAVIRFTDGVPHIKLEGSDPSKSRAVMLLIQEALRTSSGSRGTEQDSGVPTGESILPQAAVTQAMLKPPVFDYLHGSADMSSFDSLSPVLIGLFAFFFVFLIAGVSFLRERTSGTLERLFATPLRRWEVVLGYMGGFGIFTSVQAIFIAGYTVYGLGSMMVGSFGYVLLMLLLLSFVALSFGTLLSTFANSEFQMIQFIPLVIVPQVFFSGLFDLENISPWLRWITYITPLKYGADALRGIMLRGAGWHEIAADAWVLMGLSFVFMAVNVLALRKYRKV